MIIRRLHTIISREIIKPSSPTPSHLYTYNLPSLDQFAAKAYAPLVFFYPKNIQRTSTSEHKARVLKTSLSQCLTQYYPFAGRMTSPTTPYIDCNDNGVVFLEARNDTPLDTFLNLREQDETLYQLFANDIGSYDSPRNTSLVGIQLNHFTCGGIGLAVSMSHIVGDGATLGSFLTHWASLARYGSTNVTPRLLHFPQTDWSHVTLPTRDNNHTNLGKKKFVFPNSKLNELKNKVSVKNASRVEVLTSLLYKTAVTAAATRTGCFKPSYLFMMVNVRDKFVQKLPQDVMGNFVTVMMVETRDRSSEAWLSATVAEIKKQKLQLEGIESVQELVKNLTSLRSKVRDGELENFANGAFWCSSLCGLPFNKVDFGWGKSEGVTFALRGSHKNGFMLMDTPNGDGIEAWVLLEKEYMEIFENDNELLSFCQIN